ncbi:MAG: ketosynthase [Pseudomonadota bacterium]|nr:ketosynthase [Pseudomonadota bacterium]MDQ3160633.1 ketosynthase [Pseudomonadota bacterium]
MVLLYPLLAHVAAVAGDPRWAAIALGDILLVTLLDGLWARRPGAMWLALLAIPGLVLLSRTDFAMLPLLVMPAILLGIVSLGFARTLRAGRTPLIASIVEVLEGDDVDTMPPPLRRYTRGLTLAWAVLLAGLALVNAGLALLAVPGGVLASVGLTPPLTVTNVQWSWFANGFNYGIVGLFFVVEFAYRRQCFPERILGFRHFATRLARMGPSFWRKALH